jgi:hypothetical protein
VSKYSLTNVHEDATSSTSSIAILKAAAKADQIDWDDDKAPNLDDFNCFNVTADRHAKAEVHVCLSKAGGTRPTKAFASRTCSRAVATPSRLAAETDFRTVTIG